MRKYFPGKIINLKEVKESTLNYALIVLNRPIFLDKEIVESMWINSSINITVDGGTNRWLNFIQKHKLELKHPTLITGDLDSCHPESLKFFNQTKIVQTPDQDETDFTKCLRVLEPFIDELKIDHIIALCETSGRFDQIIANVNTLYKNIQKSTEISRNIYILSSQSLTWLLTAGSHEIFIPEVSKDLWCSLMPIGSPTTVTTSGLKWNLTNHTMHFGGIVSTSNKYDGVSDSVCVTTDLPLLWSMGIGYED